MSYFHKRGLDRFDQQFLAGGTFFNWIQLLHHNGGVNLRYWARGLYISLLALVTAPFRLYEHLLFHKRISETKITEPPVFILGHWRSGTTHVHRLMARNPKFAVVTFVHTMIPGLFLTNNMFKTVLKNSLPEKRPMDNVAIGLEFAEEEEYALGNMGPYSFYHALSFPKKMRSIFDRYVIFENATPEVIKRWQKMYLYFLKKMTFSSRGKQLLLKNPSNTARIPAILEMFPDAKFVHVARNPYVVYSSTMNWLDKEMVPTALQDVEEETIRENAMVNYEKLMQHYLAERDLIPEGNLIEVKFEDVEADPVGETERIYTTLGLEFTPATKRRVERYARSIVGYRKNQYKLSLQATEEISRRWGFAIKIWNYAPPASE